MNEGRRQRTAPFFWALGFSVACHAAMLAMVARFGGRSESDQGTAIVVVALRGGGIAGGDDAADEASAGGAARPGDAPAPESAAAESAEQVAQPPSAEAPLRAPERRRSTRVTNDAPRTVADHGRSSADAPAAVSGSASGAAGAQADPAASGAGSGSGTSAGSGGSAEGAGGMAGDLRASCRSCPTPEYPARARRQGWQGTVDVQLRVGRDGAVEQAEVGRSSGFTALDAAAVTVARRSKFWVSRGDGLRGQLRYRFVLEAAANRPL